MANAFGFAMSDTETNLAELIEWKSGLDAAWARWLATREWRDFDQLAWGARIFSAKFQGFECELRRAGCGAEPAEKIVGPS